MSVVTCCWRCLIHTSRGSKENSPLVEIGEGTIVVDSVSVSLLAVERQARFRVLSGTRQRAAGLLKIPPSLSGARAGSGFPLGASVGV